MIKKFNQFNKLTKEYFIQNNVPVPNFKPSVEFDKKYGTKLSHKYNFPYGLTADEVWNFISYSNRYYDAYKKESPKFIKYVNSLTEEHFPYTDLTQLSIDDKIEILFGMSSCLNPDDIIWFTIDGIKYFNNTKINNEIKKFPKEVIADLQWVVSPKTFIKLKKNIKT